jgi:hypothetical protein
MQIAQKSFAQFVAHAFLSAAAGSFRLARQKLIWL